MCVLYVAFMTYGCCIVEVGCGSLLHPSTEDSNSSRSWKGFHLLRHRSSASRYYSATDPHRPLCFAPAGWIVFTLNIFEAETNSSIRDQRFVHLFTLDTDNTAHDFVVDTDTVRRRSTSTPETMNIDPDRAWSAMSERKRGYLLTSLQRQNSVALEPIADGETFIPLPSSPLMNFTFLEMMNLSATRRQRIIESVMRVSQHNIDGIQEAICLPKDCMHSGNFTEMCWAGQTQFLQRRIFADWISWKKVTEMWCSKRSNLNKLSLKTKISTKSCSLRSQTKPPSLSCSYNASKVLPICELLLQCS